MVLSSSSTWAHITAVLRINMQLWKQELECSYLPFTDHIQQRFRHDSDKSDTTLIIDLTSDNSPPNIPSYHVIDVNRD